jgi:hypothetical protein
MFWPIFCLTFGFIIGALFAKLRNKQDEVAAHVMDREEAFDAIFD